MNRRVFSAMMGIGIGVPFAVLQLAFLVHGYLPALTVMSRLFLANLVLLLALGAVAADYPLASRGGRAALIGVGVALLMPGPTAVDSLVMLSGPALDAGSWLAALLPYLLLLAMLGCAEAGLYLLATRPRTKLF